MGALPKEDLLRVPVVYTPTHSSRDGHVVWDLLSKPIEVMKRLEGCVPAWGDCHPNQREIRTGHLGC